MDPKERDFIDTLGEKTGGGGNYFAIFKFRMPIKNPLKSPRYVYTLTEKSILDEAVTECFAISPHGDMGGASFLCDRVVDLIKLKSISGTKLD